MFVSIKNKPILWGVVASLSLSVFYLLIMFLTMNANEVWFIYKSSWYLITGIIFGFGIQIGLWVYLKNLGIKNMHNAIPEASGVLSGASMVACCAHHLVDLLPIFGFAGVALFFAQYQRTFLIFGLSFNFFGIAYMLFLIQKLKYK